MSYVAINIKIQKENVYHYTKNRRGKNEINHKFPVLFILQSISEAALVNNCII